MPGADAPTDDPVPADPTGRASHGSVSVALLAGLAFLPIVVAVGFLTDRPASPGLPGDLSIVTLRGAFDVDAAPPSPRPARAGY